MPLPLRARFREPEAPEEIAAVFREDPAGGLGSARAFAAVYPKTMVRVLVNGEDFGTMSEGAARKFAETSKRIDPRDVVTLEPVADGAQVFAHEAENVSA